MNFFNTYLFFGFSSAVFLFSHLAFSGDFKILGNTLPALNDIHYGKASPSVPIPSGQTLVYVQGACYKKNLRKVSGALSPHSSNINIKLSVATASGNKDLIIKVPARLAVDIGSSVSKDRQEEAYNNWWQSGVEGNSMGRVTSDQVFATYQGVALASNKKRISGNMAGFQLDTTVKITKINSIKLTQGNELTLKGTREAQLTQGSSGSVINVKFAVPGAKGFCGGYYSPLMVFFNKKRPSFKNVSRFPLIKNASVYWPEKNAPGYFLVLDRNNDGKITEASELFRNSNKHKNGFKHLATLDSNRDGLIDYSDKVFSKLQLWKDKNGNGISEKSELFSLKDKNLYYISLKSKSIEQVYHNRAKAVERSFFTYKNNKNQFSKAEIIDFWFAAAPSAIPITPILSSVKIKANAKK